MLLFNERSTLMQKILQKIVQDVLPSTQQPVVEPLLPPGTPAYTVLSGLLKTTMQKGCVNIAMLQNLHQLLNITGPEWFSNNLVKVSSKHV